MEKKTAHYSLTFVKELVRSGNVSATSSALKGAAALGFNFSDMKDVIENLEISDLHKSMTTHASHTIWQTCITFRVKKRAIFTSNFL